MKHAIKSIVPALLSVMLVFALTGCPDPAAEGPSSNTAVSKVTVAGVDATLGTPNGMWDGSTAGTVTLPSTHTAPVPVVVSKGESAQKIYVGKATGLSEPTWPEEASADTTVAGKFADKGVLGIKVVAGDGTIAYYKVTVTVIGGAAELFDVTVGGWAATLGTPAATYGAAVAGAVRTESGAVIAAGSPGAALQYALVSSGTGAPVWGNSANLGPISTNQFLAIKVVSASGTVTNIYKIEITALTLADVRADSFGMMSFGPPGASFTTLGTPATTPAGVTSPGDITLTLAQAAGNWVATGPTGLNVGFRYAKQATAPVEADWQAYTNLGYGDLWTINFSDGDTLWLEATLGSLKQYYKIAVSVPVTAAGLEVTSLSVAGTAGFTGFTGGVEATLGTYGTSVGGSITAGAITLTTAQAANQPIVVVGNATASNYRIAVNSGAAPVEADWGPASAATFDMATFTMVAAPLFTLAAGDVIWVQAKAGALELYYKIAVTVSP